MGKTAQAHFGVLQGHIISPFLQIYPPYVPVLVLDSELKYGLVCVYPVRLPDRVCCNSSDDFIRLLCGGVSAQSVRVGLMDSTRGRISSYANCSFNEETPTTRSLYSSTK